ncbi:MAG TPA: hypothetical protein VGO71_06750 [Baekduia sp.]|jgi:hypothetical protein|nr:hypothetical protein [Baekduia sp.]
MAGAEVDGRGGAAIARLMVPFEERSPAERVIGALVVPLVFGALCGVVLGWSAVGYWALQVLAALGGILGGFEHRGAAEGARRGAVSGVIFGAGILLGHAIAGTGAEVSLGSVPGLLPVITGVAGCAFGAIGGARRAALARSGRAHA